MTFLTGAAGKLEMRVLWKPFIPLASAVKTYSSSVGSWAVQNRLIAAAILKQASLNQGPIVQSIVSLTSSLRGQLVKCFTTL